MENSIPISNISFEHQPVVIMEPETLRLPDVFVSWNATPPSFNKDYSVMKHETERWFQEYCTNKKLRAKYLAADFPYFTATWTAGSPLEKFQACCEWVDFIFVFDDLLDEGGFKSPAELAAAKAEVDGVISLMSSSPIPYSPTEKPLRAAFESVWQRISSASSLATQERFRQSMTAYLTQVLDQMLSESLEEIDSISSFVGHHRDSVCMFPVMALIEYALDLHIPEHVFADPAFIRLREIATEIALLANDIYSFPKECVSGDPHNIVKILLAKPYLPSSLPKPVASTVMSAALFPKMEMDWKMRRSLSPSSRTSSFSSEASYSSISSASSLASFADFVSSANVRIADDSCAHIRSPSLSASLSPKVAPSSFDECAITSAPPSPAMLPCALPKTTISILPSVSEQQAALDAVGKAIQQRYREWYRVMAELPMWDERTDKEVGKYLEGVQDLVRGSMSWCFVMPRYFKKPEEVRVTGRIPGIVMPWEVEV